MSIAVEYNLPMLDHYPTLVKLHTIDPKNYGLLFHLFRQLTTWFWFTIDNTLTARLVLNSERNDMAWKKKEFVNINLTVADKKPLDNYIKECEGDYVKVIHQLLADGYKLSLNFHVDKGAYTVSITGSDDCKYNQDAILTSWSDDVLEAVFMNGYKHYVVCDGKDWAKNQTKENNWG